MVLLIIKRRYWDYYFKEPTQKAKEKEYIEELDRLFQQAVKRQLISDVELGAYLSGGMDSGSITAIAAKEFPYLKLYLRLDPSSASGIELAFDERPSAEAMSSRFKTEHYETFKGWYMERLPQQDTILKNLESRYPNFYVAN